MIYKTNPQISQLIVPPNYNVPFSTDEVYRFGVKCGDTFLPNDGTYFTISAYTYSNKEITGGFLPPYTCDSFLHPGQKTLFLKPVKLDGKPITLGKDPENIIIDFNKCTSSCAADMVAKLNSCTVYLEDYNYRLGDITQYKTTIQPHTDADEYSLRASNVLYLTENFGMWII